jgi:DUF4097 and DUF4098 domain-containing protein YvlB
MRWSVAAVLGTALFIAGIAPAQEPDKRLACSDNRDGRARQCEMREMTTGVTGRLDVDAAPNGGISVKPWNRAEVLVRAKVESWGDVGLADVKVRAASGRVSAEGPRTMLKRESGWSVSFEVFVPERTDLDLKTVNGGISVAGIRGDLQAKTTNGGISLASVAGKVVGRTTNGGIKLALDGRAWEGESCDLSTTNGGVTVEVPANYSARFVAKTTNGGLKADIPNAKVERGRWTGATMEAVTGAGGAEVKVTTTNGGVSIRERGTARL